MIPTVSRNSLPQPVQSLPKTIEGARQRYFRVYTQQFRGSLLEERTRLINITDEKIQALQIACPRFYEKNLPHLLNQVASRLMTYTTTMETGLDNFNTTHRRLLKVLEGLKTSQPVGEVNFDIECDLQIERENIKTKIIKLRNELDEMDSREIDISDLAYDDDDSTGRFFKEMEDKKTELFKQTYLLSRLDGEKAETVDEIQFELITTNIPILERLSKKDLSLIEQEILKFLKDCKSKSKPSPIFGPDEVDSILKKVDLTIYQITKNEDLKELKNELLRAFRNYFRIKESKYREEYHESLIANPCLRPKEGIILEDEKDVPEDVEAILIDNNRLFKQEEAKIIRDQAARQIQEFLQKNPGANPDDENLLAIEAGDDNQDEDSDFKDPLREVEEIAKQEMKLKEKLYVRVKEELKGDSSDDSNDMDEFQYRLSPTISDNESHLNNVHSNGHSDGHSTNGGLFNSPAPTNAAPNSHFNGATSTTRESPGVSNTSAKISQQESNSVSNLLPGTSKMTNGFKRVSTSDSHSFDQSDKKPKIACEPINLEDSDDEDIQSLGVVEPKAKIPDIITIDDD